MTLEQTIERVKRATLAMQRHAWEQGVVAQAFLELGDDEILVLMAKEAAMRQWADGRLAMVGQNNAVTDPAANGEPVLRAAQITGDEALHKAAERMRDYLLHTAPRTGPGSAAPGTLYHIDHKPQVWIDSMYMAPPFLAAIGEAREAVKQIDDFHTLLWNPAKQLYSHIWAEDNPSSGRAACWGVGNGWTAAGIARVIRALPPEMTDEKARLVGYVHQVVDGCLAHQCNDGLFHDVLDDPSTFVEVNLAQMLAYSIYRGVAGGWMAASYLEAADKMRAAAHTHVDAFGIVHDVCGAPTFDHPGVAPEGQAFFMLMVAAYRDLHKHTQD
ncbi:MAG: glycoside hydrolase family 88 protein [Anaerolineae bacterium]|nr:glycoside hydrolase family 88 protein [Anaerolineae bacterium]